LRWFKHLTDASDDDFLKVLEHEYGWEGYGRWWKLCEIVGKNVKKNDTVATRSLPWPEWQTKLKGKRNQLRCFVECLANHGRISFKETGDILEISLPKLLKYRDEYSKKSGHTTDTNPDSVGVQNTEDRSTEENRPNSRPDFTDDSREMKAAKYLFSKIRENNAGAKEPTWQQWAREFDRIFRIDGRDTNDVRVVIDWSQADPFWLTNILSPAKLRKQYDRLKLAMRNPPAKPSVKPLAPVATSVPEAAALMRRAK
jgi:hypothetical protein